jgi:hypothetical protein
MTQVVDMTAATLAEAGHAAEAESVMVRVRANPGTLAFTRDECTWAACRTPDGPCLTGSGHQPHHEREPEAGS